MTHEYWLKIEEDWGGFSSAITFSHPFFDKQQVEIFLGKEFDEDGDEIEEPPTALKLAEYATTYQEFLKEIDRNIASIQDKAFERYVQVYAHYYEDPTKSGNKPLHIDSVEKHNEYIKEILYLRVSDHKTIRLSIRYRLDSEHGIEFKFVDGNIVDVGGISET